MTFDVCFVTYRSAKWLQTCFTSLAQSVQGLGIAVRVFVADSASGDDTCAIAESILQENKEAFASYTVLPLAENKGFGAGCNAAAAKGNGDYIVFCNVDTRFFPDTFTALANDIAKNAAEFAAFEMRQLPYEHPKYYDPVTMETAWASGACVAVRRTAFEAISGFDEAIFMYCEDVELSLRLRLHGHRIRYVPKARMMHFAYEAPGKSKPLQECGSLLGNYYLRHKYGTAADIGAWEATLQAVLQHYAKSGEDEAIAQAVSQQLPAMQTLAKAQRSFYQAEVLPRKFLVEFSGLDYTFSRGGAFFAVEEVAPVVRFSVLVRAYRRPKMLAQALQSLQNQTYPNFEVIVAEDGANPVCRTVAQTAAEHLDLIYLPLERAAGRCETGNAALAAATGDYCVFLDDDDCFFADHLETIAQCIKTHPDCGLVGLGSVEAARETDANGKERIVFLRNRMEKDFSLVAQCMDNYFPIQSVAFARTLAQAHGGFDPALDLLEDWDLWTRYACHTSVFLGQKCTSIYYVPQQNDGLLERISAMTTFYPVLQNKWRRYPLSGISAGDLLAISPTLAQQQRDVAYLTQRASLQQTAQDMLKSKRWRLAAPLRAVPAVLDACIGKQCPAVRTWRIRIAPKPIAWQTADNATLSQFITQMRQSKCRKWCGL